MNELKLRELITYRMSLLTLSPALNRVAFYTSVPGFEHEDADVLPLERVQLGGLLSLVWATMWCRQNAKPHAGSPTPWDSTVTSPWVVELHGQWPCRDGRERVAVAFRAPCSVDPREPSVEADTVIMSVVARAMLHEGQESLIVDGERLLDPHVHGELGLVHVIQHVHTLLASRAST